MRGVRTNVLGTSIMADTALKYGVKKFIMISTDKAVNPSSVMGANQTTGRDVRTKPRECYPRRKYNW